MNKKQTALCSMRKYALMLPAIAMLLFFNSAFQTKAKPLDEKNNIQQNTINQVAPLSKDSIQITDTNVKVLPQFPGGDSALMKWLSDNIQYPKESAVIQGRVVVQFLVTPDGSIDDVGVIKSLDSLCDEEAIRIVKTMPKWTPGTRNGKPRSVYYSLPVMFRNIINEPDSVHHIPKLDHDNHFLKDSTRTIYLDTDDIIMPQFPGGEAALIKFLSENTVYPFDAQLQSIQGRVVLRFVVTQDGSIDSVQIVKSVFPSLDKEALRVVKAMPKWIPGKENGEPVYVYFTLPVTFRLQENETIYQPDSTNYIPVLDFSKDSIQIYDRVDVMPQFPGGEAALMKFLGDNICYPPKAVEKGTQGRVVLRFIVTPDGSIANVEAVKPLDSSFCDNEAMRVIKKMPKWIPGKENGEPVYVYFTLPVTFRMEGN